MDLATLFVVGSIWFWALVAAWTVITFYCVEENNGFFATLTLVLALLAVEFLGDLNVFTYLLEHPIRFLAGIAGYFGVGTLWSFGKWWFFVRNMRKRYDTALAEFTEWKRRAGPARTAQDGSSEWASRLRYCGFVSGREFYEQKDKVVFSKPEARHHVDRIVTWMAYWPWSMLWTLINDPVKDVCTAIFYKVQGAYQHISDSAFKGVENEQRFHDDKKE